MSGSQIWHESLGWCSSFSKQRISVVPGPASEALTWTGRAHLPSTGSLAHSPIPLQVSLVQGRPSLQF